MTIRCRIECHENTIVMGDFNCRLGQDAHVIGHLTNSVENTEIGMLLLSFVGGAILILSILFPGNLVKATTHGSTEKARQDAALDFTLDSRNVESHSSIYEGLEKQMQTLTVAWSGHISGLKLRRESCIDL
ncbi:unnamed protein product [Hymenolepis diminuta]|uniref:Endo/exonuclease/phosphatase domain-containing protein n=1 Tax=Hymenolepis diminuta TaxID=6216 RepID=A0A0R3SP30_HYMDI|nr:unnamed protein product [Hymenolepis diminuta]